MRTAASRTFRIGAHQSMTSYCRELYKVLVQVDRLRKDSEKGTAAADIMATKEYFVPSEEVMTSIVLPTIIFCIGMVVAMLVGINKCKQWELDKIVEMRRTRRVVQRITARLREKNFKTIQNARNMRKRAAAAKAAEKLKKTESIPFNVNDHKTLIDSVADIPSKRAYES
ncbi:hypothetical protein TELCIR_00026 [Teladorsagia circumcincta]|uniref:Uncharacterized protein n=1 Tax=Teladorsagia circumcincta TaxID=45464 RepID=A0A2G9V5Q6_TELCI|nr:hypothetical protein TELCIR_00026 [Teladorsagia circumcincta]